MCSKSFNVGYSQRNSYETCSIYCSSRRTVLLKNKGRYVQCAYCDKVLYTTKTNGYIFCSRKCDIDYRKYVHNIGARKSKIGKKKYYGEHWNKIADEVRERDGYECYDCGISQEEYGKKLSVHHIVPFVYFDTYVEANKKINLVSLCEGCHRKRHSGVGHASKFDEDKLGSNYYSTYGEAKSKGKDNALKVVNLLTSTDKTLSEVAEIVGVSLTTVTRIYAGYRWKELYGEPIKNTHPRGKNELTAIKIVELLTTTQHTLKDISDELGVGVSRVQGIYKGETWKNLYDEPIYIKHPRGKSKLIGTKLN